MVKDEINDLRAERKSERERCLNISNKIDFMLKKFNDDEGETLVNWDELIETEIGQVYEVNEDVMIIPILATKDELTFITVCQPNGEFGLQEHNVDEFAKILKGELIEKTQNFKIYKIGDVVHYPPYTKHKPKGGDMVNVYWVTFKKELNNKRKENDINDNN